MFVHQKIKSLQEIEAILKEHRRQGLKIVQCHGVFDLLHPGHIRHFKVAKEQGDKLVVTLTSDRFVNKGPGRPVFNEDLRIESLAALEDVDYVVLNDSPDATLIIQKVKPAVYVKGAEYQLHKEDVTGKISEEVKAVEAKVEEEVKVVATKAKAAATKATTAVKKATTRKPKAVAK